MYYKFILLLSTAFFFGACLSPTTTTTNDNTAYVFLSKSAAAKVVTIDQKENYFEKVMPLELSIQLNQELEDQPREKTLATYKKMLQDDLLNFTEEEKVIVTQVMQKALTMCQAIDPEFKLPLLQLVKTKGSYYGSGVFYTRDAAIVIPAPMIPEDMDYANEGFLSTMLHEIFHVYSRYNKDKRDALYARIGFEKLDNLVLSDFLSKRILYNPDGVDLRYAITVQKDGKPIKAVPIIYSKYKHFNPELKPFFSYMIFQLFEVQEVDGNWKIVSEDIGYNLDEVTNFWEQVTENTQYNIHPDELWADNFVLLAQSKENPAALEPLDEAGKKLVADMQKIINN